MQDICAGQIKEIYNLLGDNISKNVFENRLMYSLTEDMGFIRNVVCTIEKGSEIYNYIKKSPREKVIFGAGSVEKRLVRVYDDIKFECFVDNNCVGEVYKGLKVISIQELKRKYPNALIILSTNKYHKEILRQLLNEGFKEEDIINIGMEYEKLNHRQYFDLPQLEERKTAGEVFVDGGCYDGMTSIDFRKWCSGGRIIAWEPDPNNQKKCRQTFEEYGIEYELIPKGLWSENKILKMKMCERSSSISDMGDIVLEAASIDHTINKAVTFIKMDIEGAEYEALLGCRNTIVRYKPKLAICIYHKPEDIWELPWLIHKINPEYTFYLRHYSFGDVETVLYAL